ncbi:MAG TPA: MarR family transcriptional regulator [Ramlibacter sp.]|uniref:MarR family winged helix-turn-helix transcriptional regulator n=1 Tax=Ramlibacter sp. TaxID=1917967 RepID=UPI002D7E4F83|nr:MarR family transcriptional regulator [Ramlibacter sp.]HET8747113.1 MarR family transcriptional regulator [Ramlibacter sp.]
MDLDQFFPYRLAVLAEQVSLATAQVYASRFALGRYEWRVLAALANEGDVRPADLKERTTLEKMQVSRALARLEQDGLVTRSPDPEDGRAWRVRLLPAGMALYRKVVPMVQAREEYLLADLTPEEQAVLARAIEKVEARARQLNRQG